MAVGFPSMLLLYVRGSFSHDLLSGTLLKNIFRKALGKDKGKYDPRGSSSQSISEDGKTFDLKWQPSEAEIFRTNDGQCIQTTKPRIYALTHKRLSMLSLFMLWKNDAISLYNL